MTAVAVEPVRDIRLVAVAQTEREILRAVGANVIAGFLVAGLGGRIVMRLATLLNPDAVGLRTENGEIVGDITLGGTLFLVMFLGMIGGLVGAVVWAGIATWVPGHGRRRAALAGFAAAALAAFSLVNPANPDFLILRQDALVVGLLVALVVAFGAAVSVADEWLDRRIPRPGADPREFVLAASSVILFGSVLAIPAALGFYLGPDACDCDALPIPIGLPLLVPALATVAWWVERAGGASRPSQRVRIVGRAGLLAACALGLFVLVRRIVEILG